MNKKLLFYLGHPAHYYNISIITDILREREYDILLVARDKDVLFQLIKDTPFKKIYLRGKRGASKISLISTVCLREFNILKIALEFRPCLMIGTDIVITHIGKLLNIPSIILNEDDSAEVPFLANYGFKFSSCVLSPVSCNIFPYNNKKIEYQGYHELLYLHPKYFNSDRNRIIKYIDLSKPFYILRFAELIAHHDKGKTGINTEIAHKIIDLLSSHGNVYITSERKIEPEFEQYRIQINPIDIHHALSLADIYIGDSQTMTAEAAVLGTPALRFNDFVGKLGYLEELERKYGLTYGIKTSEPEKLYQKIKELLNTSNLKEEWKKRRQRMFSEKIDVTAFMVWFIENYPNSVKIMKENPDYQLRFK